MNDNIKKITTCCILGQILMVTCTLLGLLLAIYVVSVSNTSTYRLFEGTILAFGGFAGCYIIEKFKTGIASRRGQPEISLTE